MITLKDIMEEVLDNSTSKLSRRDKINDLLTAIKHINIELITTKLNALNSIDPMYVPIINEIYATVLSTLSAESKTDWETLQSSFARFLLSGEITVNQRRHFIDKVKMTLALFTDEEINAIHMNEIKLWQVLQLNK